VLGKDIIRITGYLVGLYRGIDIYLLLVMTQEL
jgi:hypothetical protein